jgi:hypothetical protein
MMTEHNCPPGSAEELARSLIASARLDVQPAPEAVRNGILAVLSTAGALGASSAVAGATLGALRRLGLVKWIATTAILGTVGAGAYAIVNRTPSATANAADARGPKQAVAHGDPASIGDQASVAVPPTSDAIADPGSAAGEAPESEASSAALPAQRHRSAASRAASRDKVNASDVSSLEGEVAALDLARTALAGGDATGTLQRLDQYEQAFPRGALRPEATYLRIQALSKSGQSGAARTLAARFLASHPKSPHAAQLQTLISP